MPRLSRFLDDFYPAVYLAKGSRGATTRFIARSNWTLSAPGMLVKPADG